MNPFAQTFVDLDGYISKILDISKTPRCAVVCTFLGQTLHETYRKHGTGKAERDVLYSKEILFRMASMFKVFIALALILIIDKLSADDGEGNPYRKLKSAWDKPFAKVFDEMAGERYPKLGSLPGDPTVEQLLVHFKGVDDLNHLLVAVDGTPLASSQTFLNFILENTRDKNEQRGENLQRLLYSNANYILLALLIDAASGSLADFLEKYIFRPFKMTHTFLRVGDLPPDPNQRQCYVVSSNGILRPFKSDEVLGLSDVVDIALLGPYTSATDVDLFFCGIMSALDDEKTGQWFDKAAAESLFRGWAAVDGEQAGYTRCGLSMSLRSQWPGSNSLNHLLSPNSGVIAHILDGQAGNDTEDPVYYLSGTATGWGHSAYFIPRKRVFILVMTNSSGPLDASDLISKLCLQEILDLWPSNNLARHTAKWKKMTDYQRRRAHYVQMASLMFSENAAVVKELEESNNLPGDTLTSSYPDLPGKYSSKYGQRLEVLNWRGENNNEEGVLQIIMSTGAKSSQQMRFVKTGSVFRICSRGPSQVLAVDCFHAWKIRDFETGQDEDGIRYLSRQGLNRRDYYRREP